MTGSVAGGGEPRLAGELLPEPGGGYLRFAGGDGRPWCVVLHGVTEGDQPGRGAVEVIYEEGMTYERAVAVAGRMLPQQHTHVVPVRAAREWPP